MPSSKRNRGKARRAKAAVSGSDEREGCNHGFSMLPIESPDSQTLEDFMKSLRADVHADLLVYGANTDAADATQMVMAALKMHPDVLNNKTLRESAISFLVRFGTDTILEDDQVGIHNIRGAALFALYAIALENYDTSKPLYREDLSDMMANEDFFMKYRDLVQGCERSVLRFFCRRTPCSCLNKKALQMHQPKTGLCDHCDDRIESKSLWKCTGCNAFQYCSKGCQKAAWPGHKGNCNRLDLRYA